MTKNEQWANLVRAKAETALDSIKEEYDKIEIELYDTYCKWTVYWANGNLSAELQYESEEDAEDLYKIARHVCRSMTLLVLVTSHPAGNHMLDAMDASAHFPEFGGTQAMFLYDVSRGVAQHKKNATSPPLISDILEAFAASVEEKAVFVSADVYGVEACEHCGSDERNEYNERTCGCGV